MFHKLGKIALLVLTAGIGAACEKAPPAAGLPASQMPGVRSEMLVTTEWLEEHLDSANVVVVHVERTPEGYQAGHIPGARFLSRSEVGKTRGELLNELPQVEELASLIRRLGIDQDDRVILYDEGAGLEAARAYWAFDYAGLGERTALLDGHQTKWQSEGRPISAAVPEVTPSSFVPQARPEVLVSFQEMLDLTAAANQSASRIAIVDSRPEVNYTGEEGSQAVPRPGHIPGAVNVYWQRNVVSADNPVLRPEADLRALYEEAGMDPEGLMVSYCRTGIQSSHTYFTAKYLGYDVRMYDGSFMEWSAVEGLPVATGADSGRGSLNGL